MKRTKNTIVKIVCRGEKNQNAAGGRVSVFSSPIINFLTVKAD